MYQWINTTTGESSYSRPKRVRLADNTTLTNEEVTDEILFSNGWDWVKDPDPPTFEPDPVPFMANI